MEGDVVGLFIVITVCLKLMVPILLSIECDFGIHKLQNMGV